MITRAQAEALLTLAESLEACEKLGQFFHFYPVGPQSPLGWLEGGPCSRAIDLRILISNVLPKSET
ncbi:hypothetical protein D3C87_1499980 [compost metagenome]